MYLQKIIHNYAQFNTWATERYAKWLLGLEDRSLLDAPVKSSFESINLTVQHITQSQQFWLAFISNREFDPALWENRAESVEIILQDWVKQSIDMEDEIKGFDEKALIETLHLRMRWAKNDLPRYEYIQHCLNHSTYHRGQLATIVRTLGWTGRIPSIDYNFFNTSN